MALMDLSRRLAVLGGVTVGFNLSLGPLVIVIIVWVIYSIVGYLIVSHRRPPDASDPKPANCISMTTPLAPSEVMARVTRFARASGYQVVASDSTEQYMVLGDGATLISWGFFYPLYVSRHDEGTTLVEVGSMSKLIQIGPIPHHYHTKLVKRLQAALSPETGAA